MRIAALYDIHGNLPALEAVLYDIQQTGADKIVAGGDVIVGPMSRECLDCLLSYNIPVHFILGNCETAVLAQMRGKDTGPLPPQVSEIIQWTAKQLHPYHEEILAAWPKVLQLEIEGIGKILFCHATPRGENEYFTCLTPEEKLIPVFKNIDADVVVCGHTHMQFDKMIGRLRVINAGSVGMPFGNAGAYWLMCGPAIELRYTNYDLAAACNRINATSYPGAAEFAANNVQRPPSRKKMLELFKHAELK